MNYLPQNYRDKLEFENPKTMEEVIMQEKLCYAQFKQRADLNKTWQNKKKEKLEQMNTGTDLNDVRGICKCGVILICTKLSCSRPHILEGLCCEHRPRSSQAPTKESAPRSF